MALSKSSVTYFGGLGGYYLEMHRAVGRRKLKFSKLSNYIEIHQKSLSR